MIQYHLKKKGPIDECKNHLCFELISHAILSILYPYSCKTHKISSKLGFARFLMENKWFSKKRCNIFPKEELAGCLIAHHLEDDFSVSFRASNGQNLLIFAFYIQIAFQRHLKCPNPS